MFQRTEYEIEDHKQIAEVLHYAFWRENVNSFNSWKNQFLTFPKMLKDIHVLYMNVILLEAVLLLGIKIVGQLSNIFFFCPIKKKKKKL